MILASEESLLNSIAIFCDFSGFDHIPAVGTEACRHIIGTREVGRTIDRDFVVVKDADQMVKL